jgi:hypothetical protein
MIARVWRGSTLADDRYLVEREPAVRHFEVDVHIEP